MMSGGKGYDGADDDAGYGKGKVRLVEFNYILQYNPIDCCISCLSNSIDVPRVRVKVECGAMVKEKEKGSFVVHTTYLMNAFQIFSHAQKRL
jgi:hypothetical protein